MKDVTKQHQEGDRLVRGTPLEEYLWFELMPNLMEDLLSNAKGWSTEQHPKRSHKVEGDETAHQPKQWMSLTLRILFRRQIGQRTKQRADGMPNLVDAEEQTMEATPKDEIERGTVPESTKEHGHEQVEVLAELAVTVSSHGDVEVVLEPRRKADVPTTPELGDGT